MQSKIIVIPPQHKARLSGVCIATLQATKSRSLHQLNIDLYVNADPINSRCEKLGIIPTYGKTLPRECKVRSGTVRRKQTSCNITLAHIKH